MRKEEENMHTGCAFCTVTYQSKECGQHLGLALPLSFDMYIIHLILIPIFYSIYSSFS